MPRPAVLRAARGVKVVHPVYEPDWQRLFVLIQLMGAHPLCLGKKGSVLLTWDPINLRLAHYPTHEQGGQKRSFQAK